MPSNNPWINHVQQYRKKHPDKSYKECLKTCSKTYKGGQKGGKLGGDVTRGLVGGVRFGMDKVPFGSKVMDLVNPALDEGLSQVKDWERGTRPIDSMSKKEKEKHAKKFYKKKKNRYRIVKRSLNGQVYDKREYY